jgi:hypothetical protein
VYVASVHMYVHGKSNSLLCHPSSHYRLPSHCASASHCTAASHCTPLVLLVRLVVSASASATKELSPSCGVDLVCDTKLHVQCQAGNDEKNLIYFRVQMELILIGKVAAMVMAHIEYKPEQLCIGEES